MSVMYELGDGGVGCVGVERQPSDDQDELLRSDDSDDSCATDSEDTPATCSARTSLNREALIDDIPPTDVRCISDDRLDFCITAVALAASTTTLAIVYPVYVGNVAAVSNAYVALLFPSTTCFLTLLLIAAVLRWTRSFRNPGWSSRLLKRLTVGALSYVVGCSLVVLAQLPGRVPCHLQDPLKAVVILFSLLYYFFFCKKMLGLRKLFAASVLAVGLFIAADYGLCDEFKCRGTQSHIEGRWEARASWTILYLIGLALFTLHFTLTEECISSHPTSTHFTETSDSFLATVSRIVARSETYYSTSNSTQNLVSDDVSGLQEKYSKKECILSSLWIQGVTWLFLIISGSLITIMSNSMTFYMSPESLVNATINGIKCHVPNFNLQKSVHHLVSSINVNTPTEYPLPFERNWKETVINDEHVNKEFTSTRAIKLKKLVETNNTMKQHSTHKLTKHQFKDSLYKTNDSEVKFAKHTKRIKNKHQKQEIWNATKREETTKPQARSKRFASESLASGFKIITPTMSILKDHVITNKVKPNLVGHIILNKTSANINGHQMTINPDLFALEVDHYHRRGGQNIKVTDDEDEAPSQIEDIDNDAEKKTQREARHVKKAHKRHKRLAEETVTNNSSDDNELMYKITKAEGAECDNVRSYAWLVYLAYGGFAISSIRFLRLCQSSVFTIAMMTPALPLTGIWWAVFAHNSDGSLTMDPTMSGELICALLSLPIILLGLTLLFKAQLSQHFCNGSLVTITDDVYTGVPKNYDLEKCQTENFMEYELGRRPQLT